MRLIVQFLASVVLMAAVLCAGTYIMQQGGLIP
jgi:hypothetical protein